MPQLDKRYYNQFINTLNDNVEVELKARKHLDGYAWSGEKYYINLITEDGNPLPGRVQFYKSFPAGSAGDADTDGYSFGKLRFTKAGTYQYVIAEDNAGEMIDGITYDTSKTVTIVIAKNEDSQKLEVESVTGDSTEWNAETKIAMTTITNSRVTAKVKVLKIGDGDEENPLSDVSFKLYTTYTGADSPDNIEANGTDGKPYGTLTTGPDGTLVIEGLLPSAEGSKYYLVETAAKAGYNLLTDPVEITVYYVPDPPHYEVSYDQKGYHDAAGTDRINPDEEGNCLIIINNKSGQELPLTGGPGTLPYTIGGIGLILASTLLYVFRMRRRIRNRKE